MQQNVTYQKLQKYKDIRYFLQPQLPVNVNTMLTLMQYQHYSNVKCRYYKTEIHGASTGPLHGKKVVMKDNIAVAGVPMMNGSKIMEGYIPEFDASVVTRVLDAGRFSNHSQVGATTLEGRKFFK